MLGKCRVAASCRCNAATWKNEEKARMSTDKIFVGTAAANTRIRWKYTISAGRISLSFDRK